jgi:acyl-coenzyme A thioesterase PaaI-like protein
MSSKAVQDFYPDEFAWCYGCGRLNPDGYHLKTVWEGDETVTRFTPQPYHIAIPGYVNGGVLASLIDCHGTGSAAAAAYRAEGREVGDGPAPRYVTASLRVDYLKPTPLGIPLEVRGRIKEMKGRKVVVDAELSAGDEVTVRGEVVAVQMPEHLRPRGE